MIARTCTSENAVNTDFDSEISVFKGDCDDLECVTGSHEDHADVCEDQAGAHWLSEEGTTYFILVYGAEEFETGAFALEVIEGVENDHCSNSISLEVGDVVRGTTIDASADDVDVLPCGTEDDSGSAGIWYNVEGTGFVLVASTCPSEEEPGDLNTQISVFQGDCDGLECVAGSAVVLSNEDGDCDDQAEVHWLSEEGTIYQILVFGEDEEETGDFALEIKEPLVANDYCVGAIELQVGELIAGTTIDATRDYLEDILPCGDEINSNSPGVWYMVEGTGDRLYATTCTSNSLLNGAYNSQISIFEGPCSDLQCIAGNRDNVDDACDTEVRALAPFDFSHLLSLTLCCRLRPVWFGIRRAV